MRDEPLNIEIKCRLSLLGHVVLLAAWIVCAIDPTRTEAAAAIVAQHLVIKIVPTRKAKR